MASRAAGLCSISYARPIARMKSGRVVVGNVLQGVGDARDEIIFANHGHGGSSHSKDELGRKSTKSRAAVDSESLH